MKTRSWGLRRASSQLMQASVLGDCLSILEASKIRLSMTIHDYPISWNTSWLETVSLFKTSHNPLWKLGPYKIPIIIRQTGY
jgi:hypothetical protein